MIIDGKFVAVKTALSPIPFSRYRWTLPGRIHVPAPPCYAGRHPLPPYPLETIHSESKRINVEPRSCGLGG